MNSPTCAIPASAARTRAPVHIMRQDLAIPDSARADIAELLLAFEPLTITSSHAVPRTHRKPLPASFLEAGAASPHAPLGSCTPGGLGLGIFVEDGDHTLIYPSFNFAPLKQVIAEVELELDDKTATATLEGTYRSPYCGGTNATRPDTDKNSVGDLTFGMDASLNTTIRDTSLSYTVSANATLVQDCGIVPGSLLAEGPLKMVHLDDAPSITRHKSDSDAYTHDNVDTCDPIIPPGLHVVPDALNLVHAPLLPSREVFSPFAGSRSMDSLTLSDAGGARKRHRRELSDVAPVAMPPKRRVLGLITGNACTKAKSAGKTKGGILKKSDKGPTEEGAWWRGSNAKQGKENVSRPTKKVRIESRVKNAAY